MTLARYILINKSPMIKVDNFQAQEGKDGKSFSVIRTTDKDSPTIFNAVAASVANPIDIKLADMADTPTPIIFNINKASIKDYSFSTDGDSKQSMEYFTITGDSITMSGKA